MRSIKITEGETMEYQPQRSVIITDTKEIYKVVRKYYREVYVNRFENFNELYKLLEKHNLHRLTPEKQEA